MEAIEACDLAIKYKPDYAEAYYNKGVALAKLAKYSEAIKVYDCDAEHGVGVGGASPL